MNYIKAELIKILKTKFIWITIIVYLLIYFLLFYQYTLNKSSNVIEPSLFNSVNLYSFFLLSFSAYFNIIWAVSIGSHVAGAEYSYNTIQNTIKSSGRYRPTISKAVILAILNFGFLAILIIFGLVLGIFHSSSFHGFLISHLLLQIAVAFLSTYLISLIAMTLSKIFRSTAKSNIICIILFLSQAFTTAGLHKYLNFLIPYYYVSGLVRTCFSNILGLKYVSFNIENNLKSFQNAMGILIIFTVCLALQFIIDRKREYD